MRKRVFIEISLERKLTFKRALILGKTDRLSDRNGDIGKGKLEVYHARKGKFLPACIADLSKTRAKSICELLGYK